jgi:hypothetical protein
MSQMLMTPCTWQQSAAQIITPTTSALSTINAIQAAVAASSSWSVNSSGTVAATGAKYIELKPSNNSSVYAGYRLVFFEKVVSATNKSAAASMSGTITWNSTSAIYYHFCPDGGSGTFTPANCEGANNSYVYVGSSTSYKYNAGGGIYNDVWGSITLPATAIWTYLCEGAFWLVNRSAATSHTLVGVGALMAQTTAYTNPGGSAWMQAMSYFRSGISNTTFAPSNMFAVNTPRGLWSPGYNVNSAALTTLSTPAAATYGGVFLPIFPQNGWVLRGIYNTNSYKTRTTIQDAASTVGYVWFPDDAQFSTTLIALAFMNT